MHGALNILLQGIRECRYVSVSRWASENLSQRIATREFILNLTHVDVYQCTMDFILPVIFYHKITLSLHDCYTKKYHSIAKKSGHSIYF